MNASMYITVCMLYNVYYGMYDTEWKEGRGAWRSKLINPLFNMPPKLVKAQNMRLLENKSNGLERFNFLEKNNEFGIFFSKRNYVSWQFILFETSL